MYTGIKHLHAFLPYFLIAGLLASSLIFFSKRFANREFSKMDKVLALVTLIFAHVQFLVGLILYFISPITKAARASGEMMSNPTYRFYAVEHVTVMVIAIVLITIGYSRAKRATTSRKKFGTLGLCYLLALILVLSRIPWDVWPSTTL